MTSQVEEIDPDSFTELLQEIGIERWIAALAVASAKSEEPVLSVTIDGDTAHDLRRIGGRYWFEYHCWEDHRSDDAEVWYRSHQQCVVLRLDDGEPPYYAELAGRCYNGTQLVYKVRFDDGLEWTVFEDELLDDPKEFCRSDPPPKPTN